MSSEFDLLAASLRADTGDLRAFVEALAAKLSESFPHRVHVERNGGFLRAKGPVRRLTVALGDNEYELANADGSVGASRRVKVRGIALRTEQMDLAAWTNALAAELVEEAGRSESDRLALERMLGV